MIKSLHIKNYRSFDSDGIDITNLQKLNIFLGKNDTGKTNVLRFLDFLGRNPNIKHAGAFDDQLQKPDDFHNFDIGNQLEFTVGFDIPDEHPEKEELLALTPEQPFLTFKLSGTYQLIDSFIHKAEEKLVRDYATRKLGQIGGNFDDIAKSVIHKASNSIKLFEIGPVIFIDEFRKLKDNSDLRQKINPYVNSDYATTAQGEKMREIEKFVSDIIGTPVKVQIPDIGKNIELDIGNPSKRLPIPSTGTGIHEIIILAFYLLTSDKAIVCIDEPELHLHPGLQRSFLRYISDLTDHQYFIATHSNVFLDQAVEKTIFRSALEDGATKIEVCENIQETSRILSDLGIKASEILQTNGIIWVEGPSDRIYIKKWLELEDPNLKEGFDYTFQFYGGTILKHFSADKESFKEFINLLFINRNSFVVMDSDMKGNYSNTDLSAQKQRIISEYQSNSLGSWVTAGKTIENYLSDDVLSKFSKSTVKRSKWSEIEKYCTKYKNKVEGSRAITDLMEKGELEKGGYDLSEKVAELLTQIRAWNNR